MIAVDLRWHWMAFGWWRTSGLAGNDLYDLWIRDDFMIDMGFGWHYGSFG